ncbi:cob(I)yrinic acid a,c-diamide adenosyltransferase [Alteromonas facilis]|uniref:cob(I)yrinic acid a,c-diamide adenosyltransferase n=1 Tax=Alteromonas facilis TaxID=2048004 RepID=UPI000C2890E0|nr:cob(I)yrinic acid a,c-diamide adenosyltransferase [Alteromonas facilis]
MKIYTKQGDGGTTQIYTKDTLRVRKDDAILEAYGTLDELNAHIGLLSCYLGTDNVALASYVQELQHIQRDLFTIGFAISDSSTLESERVTMLEDAIDKMQQSLPAQTHFILPGGTQSAAQAHVCRTVCRRAERVLVHLHTEHDVAPNAQQYLNRLSDYLFVMARLCNHANGVSDIPV